jgi:hypothetical protein
MKCPRPWHVLGFALTTAVASGASAEEVEDQCYLHREVPVERLLRRLSIDLRATVPEFSEYDAVAGKAEIPDEVIDAYLDSPEFRRQMRRHHEDLLWTNPTTQLAEVGFALGSTNLGNGVTVFHVTSTGKNKLYRGGDGTHVCQNKPQSEIGWETTGLPKTEPMGLDAMGLPYVAEGWVEVHPYWEADPSKTIKVCAFDAQTAETYTLPAGDPDAGTHSCDHVLAVGKTAACGCGPNLNYCMLSSAVQAPVFAAMREQLLRLVDDHTDGTRPYSELVTSKRMWINGTLAHFYKYLAQRQSFNRTQNWHSASDGEIPEIPFIESDTWEEVTRGEPHAGILTLPAYLLRFQTNRGRANRYRIAFQGQYFQPPSTKDTGCNKEGDDLTQRCVCRHCHVTLEPVAAHFGLLTESGAASLYDLPREFKTLKECSKGIKPTSGGWCDRFYSIVPDIVDPDIRTYKLKALQYADAKHPDVSPNFDAGPGGLARADIESGLFHQVATRHMFESLMKREVNLDPTSIDYEGDLLDAIAEEFRAHDNLKLLVKRIVKLPTYRRMP